MPDERPVSFESGGRLLRGMVYEPTHPSGIGIVICNPIFEELKSAGRVLVDTARALGNSGHCVLRFDYRGCGDSDGRFEEFGLGAWADDLRAAIQFLHSVHRCRNTGLLGLRLGAALALQCAGEAGCFVVAWEPVYDGKAYLLDELRKKLIKEMVTFGRGKVTRESMLADLDAGNSVDFDGYEISPRLYRSLTGLTSGSTPSDLVSPLLCIQMGINPVPPDAQSSMMKVLVDKGIDARQMTIRARPFWNLIGLVDCGELIAATSEWIAATIAAGDAMPPEAAPGINQVADSCVRAVELPVGNDVVRALLHVSQTTRARKPAVVFLHGWSGCRHGPHRMFVKCARQLAEAGVSSLRMDFRGRGASDGLAAAASISTMMEDARCAVQWLRQNAEITDIALLGICSSGKVAIGLAGEDSGIGQLVLWSAEPLAPLRDMGRELRRTKSVLGEYVRKAMRLQTWKKLFAGRIQMKLVKKAVLSEEKSDTDERREEAGMLRNFGGYKGDVLFVYGSNDPDTCVAAKRYRDFCEERKIAHEFHEVPEANHSFYSLAWEREVIDTTVTWIKNRIGSPQ